MSTNDPQPLVDDHNPWPGLASYDEASARWFHGRGLDSAELLRLIRRSTFVTLYGKSGLGKSSLLQAGIFPALRRDHHLPVYLRLDYTDTAQMPLLEQIKAKVLDAARAMAQSEGATFDEPEERESLWSWLQRSAVPIWTKDNYPVTPVLVFDQFEEIFSLGGTPERQRSMLSQLADLIGNRIPAALADIRGSTQALNLQTQQYRVVLSFRSDFLAEVESWAKGANLPRRESLHLLALARERAITAAERAGAAVLATGVAERIVDFLVEREGSGGLKSREVEPVLLSLCCYQLNRNRIDRGADRIDINLVEATAQGILRAFYDEALAGLPARVAEFVEENLILGDRYRGNYPLAAALEGQLLTQAELDRLVAARLLRLDPQGDELRIELIHDRIVSVVRDARNMRRAEQARQRERAESERRQQAEREAKDRQLEVERERARQTRRRLTSVSAALVLTIGSTAGAGYFYWVSNMRAEELEDTAKALNASLDSAMQEARAASAQLAQATVRLEALRKHSDAKQLAVADRAGAEDEAYKQAELLKALANRRGAFRNDDFHLQSDGCGNGSASAVVDIVVFVNGPITADGDATVVHHLFGTGKTDKGITFKVVASPNPTSTKAMRVRTEANGDGVYEVELVVDWKPSAGTGFTPFKSRSTQRVVVNKSGAITKAFLVKFRTECS